MAWHGVYTGVERPDRLDAEEWFVMGGGDADGAPTRQTLTFEPTGDGLLPHDHGQVQMPEPEDPEAFMEESAAGLSSSLATMDELVSS